MASYFSAPGGELWVKDLLSFENKNIEIVEAKIDWRLREGVDFFFEFWLSGSPKVNLRLPRHQEPRRCASETKT